MKFIKWIKSLFTPTECKVEPYERYSLVQLVTRDGTSLEKAHDLGISLYRMLTNAHYIFPMTLTMSPHDTTMFVIDKFKEVNPTLTVDILEHNNSFIKFSVSFLDKTVEFNCQYADRN